MQRRRRRRVVVRRRDGARAQRHAAALERRVEGVARRRRAAAAPRRAHAQPRAALLDGDDVVVDEARDGGGRPPRRGPHDDRRALAGVVARERVVGRRGRLRRGLGVRGAAEQRRQSRVDVAARVEQGGLAPAPVEAHLREALDGRRVGGLRGPRVGRGVLQAREGPEAGHARERRGRQAQQRRAAALARERLAQPRAPRAARVRRDARDGQRHGRGRGGGAAALVAFGVGVVEAARREELEDRRRDVVRDAVEVLRVAVDAQKGRQTDRLEEGRGLGAALGQRRDGEGRRARRREAERRARRARGPRPRAALERARRELADRLARGLRSLQQRLREAPAGGARVAVRRRPRDDLGAERRPRGALGVRDGEADRGAGAVRVRLGELGRVRRRRGEEGRGRRPDLEERLERRARVVVPPAVPQRPLDAHERLHRFWWQGIVGEARQERRDVVARARGPERVLAQRAVERREGPVRGDRALRVGQGVPVRGRHRVAARPERAGDLARERAARRGRQRLVELEGRAQRPAAVRRGGGAPRRAPAEGQAALRGVVARRLAERDGRRRLCRERGQGGARRDDVGRARLEGVLRGAALGPDANARRGRRERVRRVASEHHARAPEGLDGRLEDGTAQI